MALKKNTISLFILSFIFISSCRNEKNTPAESGFTIISQLIKKQDQNAIYNNSTIKFTVDDLMYSLKRKNYEYNYELERIVDTSTYRMESKNGNIHKYYINGAEQKNNVYTKNFVQSKLNGFIFLYSVPFSINTNDVLPIICEDVLIQDQKYRCLNITFKTPEDIQNSNQILLYINKKTNQIDYVAEKFEETGNRLLFRKLYNKRYINGLLFYDYYVFEDPTKSLKIDELYIGYEEYNLKDIYNIQLKDISVTVHNSK